MPNRKQMELRPLDLESLIPEGHRARLVWSYVERQDMSGFYAGIRVREGSAGRTAIAPEILFALWLFATLEGVGSARQLARLCDEHNAYRWICGGVRVNHHTLSDFRVDHGEALDALLTANLAGLMAAGVVKPQRVAQDGVRVRASAGAASFRRQEKLERYLEEAQAQVQALKAELHADPAAATRREQAARERAAREREQRVKAALERLPELAEIKRKQGKKAEEARASTTDAEATVMKMADGGYRPAYNVQFASVCVSQVICGVDVVTRGSDQGQMVPMVEQVTERVGVTPDAWLVDGGYPGHDQIDAVAEQTTLYAPVPKSKKADVDPHQPKEGDSAAVAAWRERMATDTAKIIYRDRAATAECVNAQARERGMTRLRVRGLPKVRCVALFYALAHNLMRTVALAPELLGLGDSLPAICPNGG
jgi:transposase